MHLMQYWNETEVWKTHDFLTRKSLYVLEHSKLLFNLSWFICKFLVNFIKLERLSFCMNRLTKNFTHLTHGFLFPNYAEHVIETRLLINIFDCLGGTVVAKATAVLEVSSSITDSEVEAVWFASICFGVWVFSIYNIIYINLWKCPKVKLVRS